MRLCDYILPLAVAFVNTKNRIFAIIFVAYLHHLWYYIFQKGGVPNVENWRTNKKEKKTAWHEC